MEKLIGVPQETVLPTKAVEITYVDGSVERFNTDFTGHLNQLGFYLFPRTLGQPPTLIHHLQIRKLVSLARRIPE